MSKKSLPWSTCALLLWLFISAPSLALPTALELFPNGRHGELVSREQLEILATPLDVAFTSVAEVATRSDWQPPRSNSLSSIAVDQAHWVRFRITNNSQLPGQWIVESRWPQVERIDLAQQRGDQFLVSAPRGTSVPLAGTSAANKNVWFELSLQPGEQTWVYLRVQDSRMVYSPLMIWPHERYRQISERRAFIFAAVMGAMLIMVLYNCSLFLFTRESTYILYSANVLSILLYIFAFTGYGRLYLWGDAQWFRINAFPVFATLSFLMATIFFRRFLRLDAIGGWIKNSNTAFILIWTLVLISHLTPARNLSLALVAPLGLGLTVFGVSLSGYLWSCGNKQAKYFFIAWACVSASTALLLGVMLTGSSHIPLLEPLQIGSFLIEIILLSIALADRINADREEREKAQALAIHQQAEMLELRNQANTELEANVTKRTLELATVAANLARANEELAKLNRIDGLTQVHNRAYFDEVLEKEVVRASRNHQPLAVIMVDIDHFKNINDSFGHIVGDKCLKLVAQTMAQIISRRSDLIARYGGEEFVAVLPDTNEENAKIVAEKLRKSIESIAFITESRKIPLTISLGVAGRALVPGDSPERLVSAADDALYAAKRAGRNRVELGVIGFGRSTQNR